MRTSQWRRDDNRRELTIRRYTGEDRDMRLWRRKPLPTQAVLGHTAGVTVRGCIPAPLPVPVPRRKPHLLIPIAYHRHDRRAVWIDAVVLRAITISWNNIGIPVRPYHGRRDVNTNGFGRPRLGCGSGGPQVAQHQGRSESERCVRYPHASAFQNEKTRQRSEPLMQGPIRRAASRRLGHCALLVHPPTGHADNG